MYLNLFQYVNHSFSTIIIKQRYYIENRFAKNNFFIVMFQNVLRSLTSKKFQTTKYALSIQQFITLVSITISIRFG